MVNVNEAIAATQQYNRDLWVNNAENRISEEITNAAEQGLGEVVIDLHDMIVGAENLQEVAEMFYCLAESLYKSGYAHHVTPEGDFVVTWKQNI